MHNSLFNVVFSMGYPCHYNVGGYITNVFTGLVALMDFIPIAEPLIVKVFNIPFFGSLIVGIILPQLMPSKKDMAEIH